MADFEERSKSYEYDPEKNKMDDPWEGKRGEELTPYMGTILGQPVIEEIRVWGEILMAIKDGIPKPYDSGIIVDKITRLERKYKEDFSELKKCCPQVGEIREAIQMKPFIFGILDRIVEIGEIQNYVRRYEQ